MIAQISSPLRALILLFTLVGSLYIFHPYTLSRSTFSFTDRTSNNATATEIPQSAPPAKAPEKASPPVTRPPAHNTPEIAKNHISGDLVDDPDEGGPRVRQATMVYETERFNAIYERSIDTHIKHGEQWGVPTHILRHDIVEAGFFNKPAYILGLIIEEMAKPYGKRAGWIVWFDADTIILNSAIPWTLFLPPSDFDDIHLLATRDFNGFNAGMAIFRVHEWSVQMLSETLALRQLRPDAHFEHYDQGALWWVMKREGYAEHVIYQPHNWWNSFGLAREPYDTDAFTLHFAGVDCCGQPESKGTVMGRWLDIVENRPQEYAVELEKTKLPKEVDDYWTLLKKAKKTMMDVDNAEDSPHELKMAKSELWDYYSQHADNATEVSMAIKKVEGIMAQVGVKQGKEAEPFSNPTEEALKEAEIKKNAADKAKQKAQAKKEGESAEKGEKPPEQEAAPEKKEEKPAYKDEASAKKESVEANKKAAQAEKEAAPA
ncbi:MAG: hypothetical protein ALECFALPRED_010779 [Alectoria fallacina]|uniref:Uncharacterized protein n=1 Tax=Alectoria fallacina TaxID=1903189 RepID=A0A8H3JA43_9LECA|nr:MAG: hypothetical protein ALECFALPRED_010779 [Alectoria fallacina]